MLVEFDKRDVARALKSKISELKMSREGMIGRERERLETEEVRSWAPWKKRKRTPEEVASHLGKPEVFGTLAYFAAAPYDQKIYKLRQMLRACEVCSTDRVRLMHEEAAQLALYLPKSPGTREP